MIMATRHTRNTLNITSLVTVTACSSIGLQICNPGIGNLFALTIKDLDTPAPSIHSRACNTPAQTLPLPLPLASLL